MNRGRNTRGSALANVKKSPFVSGGVLTDFTGTVNVSAPAMPLPLPSAVSRELAIYFASFDSISLIFH